MPATTLAYTSEFSLRAADQHFKMAAHCPLIIFLCFTCGLLTAGATPVLENSQAQAVTCPEGWVRTASRCFMFFNSPKTWIEAEKACIHVGGNLASIHNTEENTFIINHIKQVTGGTPRTWIGGHDAVQEGEWLWSDGSKFDFLYWDAGEPNNAGEGEHCLLLNFHGDRWYDAPNSWTHAFVCSTDAS